MSFLKGFFTATNEETPPTRKVPPPPPKPRATSQISARSASESPDVQASDMFHGLSFKAPATSSPATITFSGLTVASPQPEEKQNPDVQPSSEKASGFGFISGSPVITPTPIPVVSIPVNSSIAVTGGESTISDVESEESWKSRETSTGFSFIKPASIPSEEPYIETVESELTLETNLDQGQAIIDGLTSDIEAELKEHWSDMRRIDLEYVELQGMEDKYQNSITDLNIQVVSVKAAQALAVQNEEFDRAEELNTELLGVVSLIEEEQIHLNDVNERVSIIHSKREDRSRLTLDVVGALSTRIENHRKEIEESHGFLLESRLSALMELEDSHTGQKERLQRVLDHIQSDLEEVDAERAEVDATIFEDTRHFQDQKSELVIRLSQLNSERDQLIAQLHAKESEVYMCEDAIASTEEEIVKASTHLARDVRRLNERKENIIKDKLDRELEHSTVLESQERLASQRELLDTQERRYSEITSRTTKLIAANKQLSDRFTGFNTRRKEVSDLQMRHELELRSLKRDLMESCDVLEELKLDHCRIQLQITTDINTVSTLEARLPDLEREKNAAVKVRNFKVAGTATKEIKRLKTEIGNLSSEIELGTIESKVLQDKITKLTEASDQFSDRLASVELQLDSEMFSTLSRHVPVLIELITALSEATMDCSSEILILRDELGNSKCEVERLSAKYNWDTNATIGETVVNPTTPAVTDIPKLKKTLEELEDHVVYLSTALSLAVEEELFSEAEDLQTQLDDIEARIITKNQEMESMKSRLQCVRHEYPSKLKELEMELALAIEVEDFTAAEVLQTEITSLQTLIAEFEENEPSETMNECRSELPEQAPGSDYDSTEEQEHHLESAADMVEDEIVDQVATKTVPEEAIGTTLDDSPPGLFGNLNVRN